MSRRRAASTTAAAALLERSRETTRRYGLGAYPAAVAGAIKAGCDARAGRVAEAELELARAAPHLSDDLARLRRRAGACRAGGAPARRGRRAGRRRTRATRWSGRGSLGERLRAAALLAPLLAERRRLRARARRRRRRAGARCPAAAGAARLLALRAWLRDDEGALDDLCAAWDAAGDQVRYLVRAEWTRIERLVWEAVGARAARRRRGRRCASWRHSGSSDRTLGFLDHPIAAVRRIATARRGRLRASGRRRASRRPRDGPGPGGGRRGAGRSAAAAHRATAAARSRCSARSRSRAAATRSPARSGSAGSRPGSRASC